MSTLGNRINQAMKAKGLKRKDLADLVGISTMAVGDLINDKTSKPRHLVEIAEALNVDVKWLQTGEGNHQLTQFAETNEEQFIIPFLDVNAAAGLRYFENDDFPEIIEEVHLSQAGLMSLTGKSNTNGLKGIRVPTDSMEPTISRGDFVIVDFNVINYTGDGIYVFLVNNNLFIKRIQRMLNGKFKMISDNEAYDPEILDDDIDFHIVGRFIAVWNLKSTLL